MNNNNNIFKTIGRNITLGGIVLILLYMLWNLISNHLDSQTEAIMEMGKAVRESSDKTIESVNKNTQILGELKTLIDIKLPSY